MWTTFSSNSSSLRLIDSSGSQLVPSPPSLYYCLPPPILLPVWDSYLPVSAGNVMDDMRREREQGSSEPPSAGPATPIAHTRWNFLVNDESLTYPLLDRPTVSYHSREREATMVHLSQSLAHQMKRFAPLLLPHCQIVA
ncbi:unnamed protein product [Pleuronectes platessa]|uniref:Uncharacterized protein n=1 Tax=Pleuronectes platessa TaxID=8262 RepID=A0A9N7YNA6_PLEPL|nr:unnamed protein product [Pleuronectes platessa]